MLASLNMCNTPKDTPEAATDSFNSQNTNNCEQVAAAKSSEMSVSELLNEIKQLQTKIASLEAADAEKCDGNQIESLAQPFSGDDITTVEKWIADLENAFQALKLNDKQKLVAASRLLTGTAAVFSRTIRVSKYEDLKSELLDEFGSETAMGKVVEQLHNRRLRPEESVRRYVLEMVEMALNCTIPEQELMDIIIEGLNDPSHDVAMLYRARTMKELKRMLDRYEQKRTLRKATKDSIPENALTKSSPGSENQPCANPPEYRKRGNSIAPALRKTSTYSDTEKTFHLTCPECYHEFDCTVSMDLS